MRDRAIRMVGVNYPDWRIDSSGLLPGAESLPHVVCYPPDGPAGAEQRDEASQHVNKNIMASAKNAMPYNIDRDRRAT